MIYIPNVWLKPFPKRLLIGNHTLQVGLVLWRLPLSMQCCGTRFGSENSKRVILQQKWWRVVNTVSISKDFIAASFQNLEQDGRGCECARYGVSLEACDNSDNLQNHRGGTYNNLRQKTSFRCPWLWRMNSQNETSQHISQNLLHCMKLSQRLKGTSSLATDLNWEDYSETETDGIMAWEGAAKRVRGHAAHFPHASNVLIHVTN
jgi:hypothetical protein